MLDVYKTRYKFTGEPFRLSPDHSFAFPHPSFSNAGAYLEYGISQGEGFIAITGAAGTGKTTLINQLLAKLDRTRIAAARLSAAQLDSDKLLTLVAHAFGLQLEAGRESSPLPALEQFLRQQDQRGRPAVLIVDEAQGLSLDALEELRLLSNIQFGSRLLLQVFLVGQEPLMEMIRAPEMEHLHQRLVAATHLQPLDLDQTVDYVEHRLCHVGWKGDPTISEAALRLVHTLSGGVPRRINLVCHRLFLSAGLLDKHALDGDDARHVAEELCREGLLNREPCEDDSIDDVPTAHANGAGTPVRSLPRPGSSAHSQQSVQSAPMRDPETPMAEVAEQMPPPARGAGNTDTVPSDDHRGRKGTAVGSVQADALDGFSGGANGTDRLLSSSKDLDVRSPKRRPWWRGAALGVLGCLGLFAAGGLGITDRSGETLRTPAVSDSGGGEASVPEPVLASRTTSSDPGSVKEPQTTGAARGDSVPVAAAPHPFPAK
jgi:type II secretory pathway predicted ATPase ExeA